MRWIDSEQTAVAMFMVIKARVNQCSGVVH